MSIKDDIIALEQESKHKIKQKLSDAFDINYSVSQIRIESMDDFYKHLYTPFKNEEKIYYRGERFNSPSRKLIPTFLRSNEVMSAYKENTVIKIDRSLLLDFYNSKKQFMSVYETVYKNPDERNLYNMLAFAQHYLGVSPLIDFTKSLYVALSFAIKDRTEIKDDIVIYTAYDIGFDDTSTDLEEVNSWLEKYNVSVLNFEHIESIPQKIKTAQIQKPALSQLKEQKLNLHKINHIVDSVSPVAKLIDIPRNDLMKYQQGVFLLLNDFSLIESNYLTKTVRQSFVINKYIIAPDVAIELRKFLLDNAPQYRYDCIMNISRAVRATSKL